MRMERQRVYIGFNEDERDENECIFDIHLRVMYCNADEFRFVLVCHYARMRDNVGI